MKLLVQAPTGSLEFNSNANDGHTVGAYTIAGDQSAVEEFKSLVEEGIEGAYFPLTLEFASNEDIVMAIERLEDYSIVSMVGVSFDQNTDQRELII